VSIEKLSNHAQEPPVKMKREKSDSIRAQFFIAPSSEQEKGTSDSLNALQKH